VTRSATWQGAGDGGDGVPVVSGVATYTSPRGVVEASGDTIGRLSLAVPEVSRSAPGTVQCTGAGGVSGMQALSFAVANRSGPVDWALSASREGLVPVPAAAMRVVSGASLRLHVSLLGGLHDPGRVSCSCTTCPDGEPAALGDSAADIDPAAAAEVPEGASVAVLVLEAPTGGTVGADPLTVECRGEGGLSASAPVAVRVVVLPVPEPLGDRARARVSFRVSVAIRLSTAPGVGDDEREGAVGRAVESLRGTYARVLAVATEDLEAGWQVRESGGGRRLLGGGPGAARAALQAEGDSEWLPAELVVTFQAAAADDAAAASLRETLDAMGGVGAAIAREDLVELVAADDGVARAFAPGDVQVEVLAGGLAGSTQAPPASDSAGNPPWLVPVLAAAAGLAAGAFAVQQTVLSRRRRSGGGPPDADRYQSRWSFRRRSRAATPFDAEEGGSDRVAGSVTAEAPAPPPATDLAVAAAGRPATPLAVAGAGSSMAPLGLVTVGTPATPVGSVTAGPAAGKPSSGNFLSHLFGVRRG